MKKISIIVLVSAIALSCAFAGTTRNAGSDFLAKQKSLFELLQHTHQLDLQPRLLEIANNYMIEQHYDDYSNLDAVQRFVLYYKHGLLPMNEMFSVYNLEHRKQMFALFQLFYYAKDWNAFYNSIVWARFNVNEGQFVYALTVALIHRTDMQGLELPAIYEIYPYYFFGTEVIQRAQLLKQQGFHGMKKVEGVYSFIIQANQSGSEVFTNDEQRLAYFTEDVGLNAFYYYFHMDYPFWLGGDEMHLLPDRRGELFLYTHQQMVARYFLERLSNDMGYINDFTWWTPIKTGYYPNLRSYSGQSFATRENGHIVYEEKNYFDVDAVSIYESRLFDAIDLGYILLGDGTQLNITKPEGIELLGNLIQGNPDSVNVRYYKYLEGVYRTIGQSFAKGHITQYSVFPSVLEHPEMQLRDPAYWQFLRRMNMLYFNFKENLPIYIKNEIEFEGVKIESVDVEKLITYFDSFDADITNAVDIEIPMDEHMSDLRRFGRISHYQGEDIVIKARQLRLNHVPFKVSLQVSSLRAQPSIIRLFLGPKYDESGHLIDLNENRANFVLLDKFKYDLNVGNNLIVRESNDFFMTVRDRTTYYDLYKLIMGATNGDQTYPLGNYEAHSGFPNRLMLPKGKKGGQIFKLFVHISPYNVPLVKQYTGYDHTVSVGIGSGARWLDSLPFGFPLDRKIDELIWYTPNMLYYDVNIFHKQENEINRT